MFSPRMRSHEPYYHFKSTPPSPFPQHNYTSPNIPLFTDPYTDQPRQNHRHQPHKFPPKPRHSTSNFKTPDFSSQSDFDLDTDSSFTGHLHTSPYYPHRKNEPNFEVVSQFKHIQIRVPKSIAHDLRSSEDILILPSPLTHLKISVYAQHASQMVRVAVAGDMRLREVVKQILPQECIQDAKAYVKVREEWIEPESRLKMSEVVEVGQFAVNERREVEVRVVVGGGGRERQREDGNMGIGGGWGRHGRGWFRERGSVEKVRVY